MNINQQKNNKARLTLSHLPLPAKVLVTMLLLTLSLGMTGAAGQIIVHDIIPTFFSDKGGDEGPSQNDGMNHHLDKGKQVHQMDSSLLSDETGKNDHKASIIRGDLFDEAPIIEGAAIESTVFYKSDQFIWLLKWTHIHLFGINFIFIILGTVTYLLNLNERVRAWLIALPFLGILIDIAALWLKSYISPVFFWLHIPGGGVFGSIFAFVFFRGFWEMWIGSIKVDSVTIKTGQ